MRSEWKICVKTKKLRHVKGDEVITLHELFNRLKEAFCSIPELIAYEFPIIAITPEIYEMTNGYEIEESSMKYLTGGSIEMNKMVWGQLVDLGHLPVNRHEHLKLRGDTDDPNVMNGKYYIP